MTNYKRSGKFYRKNEKEVMLSLGLNPTLNSGSGWIEKEDGQNDFIICQLKSTDAQSIRLYQKDFRILEENAAIVKKIPLFAIQFLNTNEVWVMSKPENLDELSQYLKTGKINNASLVIDAEALQNTDNITQYNVKKIKSSSEARKKAKEEIEIQRVKRSEEWKKKLKSN